MSDERSERMKRRRQKTNEKVEPIREDKEVKTDKPDKAEAEEEEGEKTPVKDRDDWGALQMQLPDDLRDELEIALDETNLELRKAGEEKLEKLAHWYPLIVETGVTRVQEMDADEIQERIGQFE